MKKIRVFTFLPARDEEKNLPDTLTSLTNQTLKPFKILVINDASIDQTREIAEAYSVNVINLTDRHPSYSSPERGWMLALVWNHAFPPPKNTDYILQMGADVILPPDYIERMVELMEQNSRLVIASGMIEGEKTLKSHVRGAGRLYKAWFWNQHIRQFPLIYCTESYPLYKALTLGFEVQSFPDIIMKTQRPTNLYKAKYGYAMRELGYFPPFALAKCFLSFLMAHKTGVTMFRTYLTSPFKQCDKTIQAYLRLNQIRRILHFKESLKIWMSRL